MELLANKKALFDGYAGSYRDVINRVSKLSGEEYEYFIGLRVGMMASRLKKHYPGRKWGKVLDFGCGTGATEEVLAKHFTDAAIFGIDESADSIDIAVQRGTGASFDIKNTARLPYADGTFDLVYMNGVLHHIPTAERQGVIRELRRVLKQGGDLFLFENNPMNPLMMRAMAKNPFDRGVTAIPPADVRKLAHWTGFGVAESWFYFFFPHALRGMRWMEPGLKRLPVGAQYAVWMIK